VAADIPLIDLADAPAALAAAVDQALRTSGFLLVTGHGIDASLPDRLRAEAFEFFHLDAATKAPYRSAIGVPGWLPMGLEANGYTTGVETPPDAKEVVVFAPADGTRLVDADGFFTAVNRAPAEVPGLAPAALEYLGAVQALAHRLLDLLALALDDVDGAIAAATAHAASTLSLTWYPAVERLGPPLADQWRIGPHSDFGTITLLDRQPGMGGLQVQRADGEWIDAPYEPGALTVNIGDLMARWTGDRWRSTLHRVLPPPVDAPAEELLSLVYFFEADLDALIETLPPPIGGGTSYEPVTCAEYLRGRLEAITVQ
jgi:isopenicillin N synthase-like dioxygenase